MLKGIKAVSLSILLSGAMISISHAKQTEKLSINKHGIKVWTYQDESNPIVQYRAETIVNTTLETATLSIINTEISKTWIPYISDIKILSSDREKGNFLMYMRIGLPFPLKDRDMIVQGKLIKDKDGRLIVENKAIQDGRYPPTKDAVRITKYQGDWIFEKLSDQQVKVITSGYADPAGVIPLTIVNNFVQQQPYQTLQRLKKQILTQSYSKKDLPAIFQ